MPHETGRQGVGGCDHDDGGWSLVPSLLYCYIIIIIIISIISIISILIIIVIVNYKDSIAIKKPTKWRPFFIILYYCYALLLLLLLLLLFIAYYLLLIGNSFVNISSGVRKE